MGIALDGKLQLTACPRSQLDAGQDREQAVFAAFRHCGVSALRSRDCPNDIEFVPAARLAWISGQ